MPTPPTIRIVDLSPFFTDGDESGRKKAKDTIAEACMDYGLFQIVNHGIPLELMDQLMDVSKTFFDLPDEVKRDSIEAEDPSIQNGYYFKQPDKSVDRNEYVFMYAPGRPNNGVPSNPPQFRKSFEEVFKYFLKTCQIMEEIINDCLGLPQNFLKEYNNDRSADYLVASRYPPATENHDSGLAEHEDGSLMTIVFQQDVDGLEVKIDGEWYPVVVPSKDTLIVNLSDIIQVLSNKKFKSSTHRVVRPKGTSRHSLGFFYCINPESWVEPLPEFTKEIGEKSKYKGFYLKDYAALRISYEKNPTTGHEGMIRISHYEI